MIKLITVLIIFSCLCSNAFGFSGEGYGYKDDPYQITNVEQLQEMNDELDAHYILMNDIDASDTKNWNNGQGFIPIGDFDALDIDICFTGSLDGQNFIISDLTIQPNKGYSQAALFFAIADGCILRNIIVVGANVMRPVSGSGAVLVGTIFARDINKEVLVEYCSTSGFVDGDGGFANKIYSINGKVTVIGCFSTVDVIGKQGLGGFCGSVSVIESEGNVLIEECYSTGSVLGDAYLGGFTGGIGLNSGKVTLRNCFSRGSIIANIEQAGGFIGGCYMNDESAELVIEDCYSTGNVTSPKTVGGFLGYRHNDLIINFNNCYWDRQTSGHVKSVAGTGKTTTDMKKQETYETWDFDNIWTMNPNVNDGYPYLRNVTIVSVQDETDEVDILIYPNPTKSSIVIDTELRIHKMQIFDINGKMVKYISSSNNKIDLIELPSGNYILKLFSGKKSFTKQFAIVR
jgi:hypothetical protein